MRVYVYLYIHTHIYISDMHSHGIFVKGIIRVSKEGTTFIFSNYYSLKRFDLLAFLSILPFGGYGCLSRTALRR